MWHRIVSLPALLVFFVAITAGCIPLPPPTPGSSPIPTPTPTSPPAASAPLVTRDFHSTSGQTFIQYYTYTSPPCTGGVNCNFRGLIHPPAGFSQAEVFLTGFTLEGQTGAERVQNASAEVHKYRYDPVTGDMEVGVTGRFVTETRQPHTYQISFVVLLTNAAAKLTPIDTGCAGTAQCHVTATLVGAVPSGMQYIGLGTRRFDLGSSSTPISVNTLSMHINTINLQVLPDVLVDYLCAFEDAAHANRMFCEWGASVIAFDPAEMDRNDSSIFPQYTMIGNAVPGALQLSGQAKPFSGGAITGSLDALEGVTFLYPQGQQNALWLIDASASQFQTIGSPATTAASQYSLFEGTTFGDRVNSQPYSYQLSRAVGLLR